MSEFHVSDVTDHQPAAIRLRDRGVGAYPCHMTASRKVSWLRAQLDKLDSLHGVERVRLADELAKKAPAILVAEGDRGVWEALHRGARGKGAEVAEQLGTTLGTVHNRSSRHKATVKTPGQHK